MMKVLLISNYLPDEQESMLRYARLVHGELNKRGVEAEIVYPPAVLTRLTGRSGALGKWVAYVDKYLLAPSVLRRAAKKVDVVHVCDHSNSMYLKCAGNKPSLITCHDLLAVFAAEGRFPGIHVGGTGKRLQRWIASGLKRARVIVCVSHKTAEDTQELIGESTAKLAVVPHSLNWPYHPVNQTETDAVLRKRGLAAGARYVLHVGSNSWYKNRPAVVKIFAALKQNAQFAETKLLLAGKPWDEELSAAVEVSGCVRDIVQVGDVSNEELRALYSGAQLFLFPSREEGFGWPILEAQACGCLVATTNHAPMTEVAGDGAILIDPLQPEAAARAILEALPEDQAIRERGLKNAATFTMDRSMKGLLEAYRSAIGRL